MRITCLVFTMLRLLSAFSQATTDNSWCRQEQLDSIEDIPLCHRNRQAEGSNLYQTESQLVGSLISKDYPLIHLKGFTNEEKSIFQSDHYGKNKVTEGMWTFERLIHGKKYLLIRIELSFVIKKEQQYGNTIIIQGNTKTYEYPLRDIKLSNNVDYIEFSFTGAITNSYSDLIIKIRQTINQKQQEKRRQSCIIITKYRIWGQNYFDRFQSECSDLSEVSDQVISTIPAMLSPRKDNFLKSHYSVYSHCLDSFEFNDTIRQCLRKQTPCVEGKKELLNTKSCEDNCPEGQFEFALPGSKSTYCSESFDTCLFPCLKCDMSGKICFVCHEGFQMQNGDCQQNKQVTTFGKEIKPYQKSKRILYNGNSSRCTSFFNLGADCYSCMNPFIVIHGDCFLCPRGTAPVKDLFSSYCKLIPIPGCSDLDSSGNCRACFLGYLLSSGSCNQISSCSIYQYLDIDNACHNCSEIGYCSECYNGKICKVCNSGYKLVPQNGISTLPYLGCELICPSGYFLNSDNLCQACGFHCDTCSSPGTVCTSCMANYDFLPVTSMEVTTKQRCMALNGDCPQGCNTCILNGSGENECASGQCQSPYVESSGNCLKCGDNCQTCSSSTTCNACYGGITLVNQQCPKTCTGSTYMDQNYNCTGCSSSCSNCSNQDTCDVCSSGYISLGGICMTCPSNCSSCSNEFICTACSSGYSLNPTTYKCDSSGCLSNQYLSGGSCVNCTTGCLTCSSGSVCASCILGYTLNSFVCEIICSSTFFRDSVSNTCKPCIANCLACSNSSTCNNCSPSYVLQTNQTCSLPSSCGDGDISSLITVNGVSVAKQCDDKNTINGDGCSSVCQIESQYSCQYDWGALKSVCTKQIIKNDFTLFPQNNSKNNNPTIIIKFTRSLIQYSSTELLQALTQDIVVSISSISSTFYTYKVSINDNSDELTLIFTLSIEAKNKIFQIMFSSQQFLTQNYLANNSKSSDFPDYMLISSETVTAADVISTIASIGSSSMLASVIPIILFSNFQLLFNALDLFQMMFYLQYVNIRLPYNAVVFIDILSSFTIPFSTNFIQIILDADQKQSSYVPKSFSDRDIDGVFLENTGDSFSQLIILATIHLLLILLSKLFASMKSHRYQSISSFLNRKLQQSWQYGWYLDTYWDMYLSLVIGVILQLYEISIVSFQSAISIILAFLTLPILILTPVFFAKIIYSKSQILEEEHVHFKWGMLYENLQLEEHPKSKVFPETISHPPKRGYEEKVTINFSIQSKDNNLLRNQSNNNTMMIMNKQKNSEQMSSFVIDLNTIKKSSAINLTEVVLSPQKEITLNDQEITNTNSNKQPSKNIGNRFSKYFYVILYARKLFFGVLIAGFNSIPYVQLVLINVCNVIIIALLLAVKPFCKRFENLKNMICEILMLMAQTSLILLIPDQDDQEESTRINLGWIFISYISSILLLQMIFVFVSFISDIKQQIKQICSRKKSKKIQKVIKPMKEEGQEQEQERQEQEEEGEQKLTIEIKKKKRRRNNIQGNIQLEVNMNTQFQQIDNAASSEELQNTNFFQVLKQQRTIEVSQYSSNSLRPHGSQNKLNEKQKEQQSY